MDYGETLAYWYLRLNGFFPLTNFVNHRLKEKDIEHPSDCDVLAVRPPHVFEDIGGKPDDIDPWIWEQIKSERTLGIICEVKTGRFDPKCIFRQQYNLYNLQRLGFTDDFDLLYELSHSEQPFFDIKDNFRVIKLFISAKNSNGPYINCTVAQLFQFLLNRVNKYPIEKYQDRMFFNSILFQGIIEINHLKKVLKIND